MEAKKIVGIILQVPMYFLILGSFIASIYAAYKGISGINWATPIILACIIIAYMIGIYLKRNETE